MRPQDLRLPSVSEYVAAFRAIDPKITSKQHELLVVHHSSPARVTSASKLAEAVGFESYKAVNLQYGLLAAEIARELSIESGGVDFVEMGILVEFVDPGLAENDHFLWVLRPNVAQALEDLGWAPRVSHLLYPEFALKDAAVAQGV